MKNIVSRMLSIIFLAMSPVAIANAQNSNTVVSSQELQKVQSQVNAQSRAIKNVKGDVRSLKAGQADQAAQISAARDTAGAQEIQIKQVGSAAQGADKSAANAPAAATTLKSNVTFGWVIGGVLFLFACGIAGYGGYRIKRRIALEHNSALDDLRKQLEGKIAEVQTSLKAVYVNSSKPELRQAWKDLREKNPSGELTLALAEEFKKSPEKGHDLEGIVEGYTAVFDDSKPLEKQVPKVSYGGKRIPWEDMRKHAEEILRSRSNAQPKVVQRQPIELLLPAKNFPMTAARTEPKDPTFGGLLTESFMSQPR